MAVELELVHPLLGEAERALRALDLVVEAELAAGADPARADRADGAVGEPDQVLAHVLLLDRAACCESESVAGLA